MTLRSALVLVFVAGCGGATQEAPPPEAASPGMEDQSAPAAEPEPAPEPTASAPEVPPASGPATLSLDARVKDQSVPATVRLLTADGKEAASGKTGQAIEVQSGEYTLEVQIDDAAAMLDRPAQRRQLVISAGDELHEKADFPWTMIQLNVRVNGRLDRGAEVILKRDGAEVATVKSGASPAAISPGRYEATVKTRGTKIDVKGMLFPEGGTESKAVDVSM